MISTLTRLAKLILRGYGQVFVANGVVPGALIFLGLLILVPIDDALRSLLCAAIVTAWAIWRSSDALVETGLFGVNGVLLGLLWMLFPEVSEPLKYAFCIGGAFVMSIALVPTARFIQKKRWPCALFSAPYVATAWLTIALLYNTGTYDRNQFQGWAELVARRSEIALQHFTEAKASTPKSEAFRENGLGWANYHLGHFDDATTHFQRATQRLPDHADSFAGLGWSHFKKNQFLSARKYFETSIELDPFHADAWDGLGWVHFVTGEPEKAKRCFDTALNSTPLLADAYAGLYQCALHDGDGVEQNRIASRFKRIEHYVSPGLRRVTGRQALCWLLFLIAIGIHSRTSLCVVVAGLSTLALGAHYVPTLNRAAADTGFVYNILALYLALGGQYMRLTGRAIVWMVFLTFALAILSSTLTPVLLAQGLPALSLLFNASLIVSLLLARTARLAKSADVSVPLEVAVINPQTVRRWWHKCQIAHRAQQRIEASGKSP